MQNWMCYVINKFNGVSMLPESYIGSLFVAGGGGASAAISLDHFFHSLKQYYFSLSRDSAHKATPTGCAITPQELEGLKNVLKIIQTIAKHVCWPNFPVTILSY